MISFVGISPSIIPVREHLSPLAGPGADVLVLPGLNFGRRGTLCLGPR